MSGVFVGFGRVIGMKQKSAEELGTSNNLLELSVAVDTGERKREGMAYAPSNIYQIPIWGKRADALVNIVTEGKHVFFKGKLGVPQTYLKDGEARCSLVIADVDELKVVQVVYNSDSSEEEAAPVPTAKEAKSKASKKNAKTATEFNNDDDVADLNFD